MSSPLLTCTQFCTMGTGLGKVLLGDRVPLSLHVEPRLGGDVANVLKGGRRWGLQSLWGIIDTWVSLDEILWDLLLESEGKLLQHFSVRFSSLNYDDGGRKLFQTAFSLEGFIPQSRILVPFTSVQFQEQGWLVIDKKHIGVNNVTFTPRSGRIFQLIAARVAA